MKQTAPELEESVSHLKHPSEESYLCPSPCKACRPAVPPPLPKSSLPTMSQHSCVHLGGGGAARKAGRRGCPRPVGCSCWDLTRATCLGICEALFRAERGTKKATLQETRGWSGRARAGASGSLPIPGAAPPGWSWATHPSSPALPFHTALFASDSWLHLTRG